MKLILISILFFVSLISFAQQREFEMKEGDTTYVMKQYFFCIYIRGEKTDQDSAALVQLQKGHLENITAMDKAGVICMAGPFGDDTEKRGILMFDVTTEEEAIAWLKKDPMVIEGRLTYEIHPWWGAKGSRLK